MKDNFQEYEANFSAIMRSQILTTCRKEVLLKNILKDINFAFLKEFKDIAHSEKKESILKLIFCLENRLKKINKKTAGPN